MAEQKCKKNLRRALMICYYFPPCPNVGALRPGKFVKYLNKFGWHCEVLTAYRGQVKEYDDNQEVRIHPTTRIDLDEVTAGLVLAFYSCRNLVRKLGRIIQHKRLAENNTPTKSNPQTVGGFGIATSLQRWRLLPDSQFIWIFLALPKALWFARKCDVIYSSLSPYSAHVLGLLVKKLTHKPWLADYRDEWTLNCRWKPATKFHRWLGKKLDKACVKNADIIINTTEVITNKFIDKFGGSKERFVTIPNGYDEDDIAKFRGVEPDKKTFVMTSIGSLYGGRDAKPFLKAMAQTVKNGKIGEHKLNINLIGGQNPNLVSEVEKLGLNNVTQVLPRMSQEEAFAKLAKSHLAILIGSDMEKAAMTTKVYEYAGMGKPILALVPHGPVYDFVNKYGGWCAPPDDIKEIKQTLTDIFEMHQQEWPGTKIPPDIRKYDRCELTRQLARYFDGCINES